jgi:hypothetical protein
VSHKKKKQKCRNTDSDVLEENQEGITFSVNTSWINTIMPLEPKWEFMACNIDSDDDDEELELVDGVDFNVYLTRRLFALLNRIHLDLCLVEAEDAILLARKNTTV